MNKQGGRGFTIVELAVVIIVMGLLLVLAVVSFRGVQAAARDKERQADVQSAASYLESIYQREIRDGTTVLKPAGEYPSIETLSDPHQRSIVFADLETGVWHSPSGDSDALRPVSGAIRPEVTNYQYQPISGAGGLCRQIGPTQGGQCRAFRIHYKLESGATEVVESKHR